MNVRPTGMAQTSSLAGGLHHLDHFDYFHDHPVPIGHGFGALGGHGFTGHGGFGDTAVSGVAGGGSDDENQSCGA
jgi:hypothetical protein